MEEYIRKIGRSFNNFLADHFSGVTEIEVRGLLLEIIKFMGATSEVNLSNIKPHELLSGQPITLNIQGDIRVSQKIKGGSRPRFISFWAHNTTIRFDMTTEEFEIINVPQIQFIDFNN
jgi:hypothetical protein